MKLYNMAVVGATGLVGERMIKVLEERKFPVGRLLPLASEASHGKKIRFRGVEITVEKLRKDSFKDIDLALFSAGGDVSLEYAPIAAKAGAVVIDNTAAFRMDPDVPLVVPEVNGHVIASLKGEAIPCKRDCHVAQRAPRNDKKGFIIANPNCSTIQLVCVLKPIHDAAKIKRVVVSTYQSVSGAGKEALEKLDAGERPFAFNCIPQIDVFTDNGYTKEEMKVVNETRKILGDSSVNVTCTAVRVPVRVSHSESVNIETEKKLTAEDARNILKNAPGVIVIDDPSKGRYPMPVDCEDRDEAFVGRIREDISIPNGIECWIVSDNLRKGAATNAVQIAELLGSGLTS